MSDHDPTPAKPSAEEALAARTLAERIDVRTGTPIEAVPQKPGEIGGPKGPEPTRYGDWEVNGRCSDF